MISARDTGSPGAISFPTAPAPPMISSMDGITLPPELDRFAVEAVASGRYASRDEVIAAGVRLLKETDAEVTNFVRSLEDARDEATRDGWHSLDDVMAEADEIIAGKRNAA